MVFEVISDLGIPLEELPCCSRRLIFVGCLSCKYLCFVMSEYQPEYWVFTANRIWPHRAHEQCSWTENQFVFYYHFRFWSMTKITSKYIGSSCSPKILLSSLCHFLVITNLSSANLFTISNDRVVTLYAKYVQKSICNCDGV